MRSGMARVRGITQFYLPPTRYSTNGMNHPAFTPYAFVVPPEQGSTHPIIAHCSFIDIERMKGWVGLVGWLFSGRFTYISGHVSAAGRAYGRESLPVTDWRSPTVPRNQLAIETYILNHPWLVPDYSNVSYYCNACQYCLMWLQQLLVHHVSNIRSRLSQIDEERERVVLRMLLNLCQCI